MSTSGFDALGYGMTVPGDVAGRHGHGPAALSTGDIVAIVLAVVVALLVAGILVCCCCFRKRKCRATAAPPPFAGIRGTSHSHRTVQLFSRLRRFPFASSSCSWDVLARAVDVRGSLELAGAGGGATGRSPSAAAVATGRDAPGAGSGRDAPRCSSAAAAAGHDAPAGPSSGAVGVAGCRLCRRAGYGVEVAVALDCGHSFHRRCIRRWMHHNMSCPTCNATHIAFLGDSSEFRLQRSGEHAPRRSVDAASMQDGLLVEISRSTSSRF
ncbi:unnamed protein product [Urochloa decumbens]|uniref:RING-type domain-containing protein n=1 Tax=Urochloa decumbens TaxID=240449 RepID=A0ABC9C1E9_9POAL